MIYKAFDTCLKLFQPHFFPGLRFGFSHTEVLADCCMFHYGSRPLTPRSLWKALHSFLCLVNSYSLFKTQFNSLLLPLHERMASPSGILRYNKALLTDLPREDSLVSHSSSSVPYNMLTDATASCILLAKQTALWCPTFFFSYQCGLNCELIQGLICFFPNWWTVAFISLSPPPLFLVCLFLLNINSMWA